MNAAKKTEERGKENERGVKEEGGGSLLACRRGERRWWSKVLMVEVKRVLDYRV
jgi:hypothetical protein